MSISRLFFWMFGAFIMLGFTSCQVEESPEKPNVLFIAVDDLRPEINAYGASHIVSPGLDKLAEESMVFERAYCNVPVCGASRASLMSGKRPGRYRFVNYHTWLDKDYPGVTSLPELFKENGYTTISNGKIYHHLYDDSAAWHEIWHPSMTSSGSWRDYQTQENIDLEAAGETRGNPYERAVLPDTAYFDGKIAKKAIQDLEKLKNQDEPFFLAVGFLKPHLPFNAPEKYWDIYDTANISLPANYIRPEPTPRKAYHNSGELRAYHGIPPKGLVSDAMAKQLIHGYYACVSYTDAQIQKVLTALNEMELADNTIVVLWGDHGWNLGDHQLWCKHCNFESSLHTPLMIKVPGKTKGERTRAITEFIDIYPTLAELAGLPIPEHADGESLVSLINGEKRTKDFAILKYHDGVTIVKDNWFYTEWIDEGGGPYERMLFDHDTDPLELSNLAEKPEYADKVQELHALLHENWGDDFFDKAE